MIDFSKAIEELNSYKGSEKKKTLIYDNKKYLVKFPDPIRQKNKNISYINNAFSEFVGSNIFKIIGLEVQNTLLGTYMDNEKEKIVCACEDFTSEDNKLYEFESLALSVNTDKKIDTELLDITEVIDILQKESSIIITDNIKEKFWDMFVVDSLIGNTDRHNGNWGLLVNVKTKKAIFSPIYDNGSCLNPLIEEENFEKMSDTEIKNLAVNCYSCIKENGKKINYNSYIKSMKNNECNSAIKRIFPKINITLINEFIDNISCMSNKRKEFYKKIIFYRYEVLNNIYNKLSK